MAVVAPSHDVNEALRSFKENDIDVIMSGWLGEEVRFYYMDTDPILKMIVETVSGHAISMRPLYTYP